MRKSMRHKKDKATDHTTRDVKTDLQSKQLILWRYLPGQQQKIIDIESNAGRNQITKGFVKEEDKERCKKEVQRRMELKQDEIHVIGPHFYTESNVEPFMSLAVKHDYVLSTRELAKDKYWDTSYLSNKTGGKYGKEYLEVMKQRFEPLNIPELRKIMMLQLTHEGEPSNEKSSSITDDDFVQNRRRHSLVSNPDDEDQDLYHEHTSLTTGLSQSLPEQKHFPVMKSENDSEDQASSSQTCQSKEQSEESAVDNAIKSVNEEAQKFLKPIEYAIRGYLESLESTTDTSESYLRAISALESLCIDLTQDYVNRALRSEPNDNDLEIYSLTRTHHSISSRDLEQYRVPQDIKNSKNETTSGRSPSPFQKSLIVQQHGNTACLTTDQDSDTAKVAREEQPQEDDSEEEEISETGDNVSTTLSDSLNITDNTTHSPLSGLEAKSGASSSSSGQGCVLKTFNQQEQGDDGEEPVPIEVKEEPHLQSSTEKEKLRKSTGDERNNLIELEANVFINGDAKINPATEAFDNVKPLEDDSSEEESATSDNRSMMLSSSLHVMENPTFIRPDLLDESLSRSETNVEEIEPVPLEVPQTKAGVGPTLPKSNISEQIFAQDTVSVDLRHPFVSSDSADEDNLIELAADIFIDGGGDIARKALDKLNKSVYDREAMIIEIMQDVGALLSCRDQLVLHENILEELKMCLKSIMDDCCIEESKAFNTFEEFEEYKTFVDQFGEALKLKHDVIQYHSEWVQTPSSELKEKINSTLRNLQSFKWHEDDDSSSNSIKRAVVELRLRLGGLWLNEIMDEAIEKYQRFRETEFVNEHDKQAFDALEELIKPLDIRNQEEKFMNRHEVEETYV